MLKVAEGIYRDGKAELLEIPEGVSEGRVIVIFLPSPEEIDLESRPMNKAEAADLRARLSTFAEDWDRPEMDLYDTL